MLLATDLDGTFLAGDDEARRTLYRLIRRHPGIQLAYVTGRGLESVLPLLADPALPKPDYIICDVGATVVDGASRRAVQPLQAQIENSWPGEHSVREQLAGIPGLIHQDVPQERRCSYFCEPGAVTESLRERAERIGCDLLFSAGRYLDVLPRGVNKGSTLRALVEHLGFSSSKVLVAGDTLNDLSMYQQGFKGVCVGDSEPALLEATRGLSTVMHATRPGCGGILEALTHFGFLGEQGVAAETVVGPRHGKAELVMLYHRLPYEEIPQPDGSVKRQRPRSPNGIIPTLLSFFGKGQPGAWVAWSVQEPGETFQTHTDVDPERYPDLTSVRVPLSNKQVDIFYKSFSKEAFWPTLHTFWERARFREDHWQVYLEVNRRFAEAAAAEAAPGALVWIHDYNLWMVPAFLRELRTDVRIAFFHHTYFPSADVFNVLPWRRSIIGSLLQCDYIGFHIPRQTENFVDVVRGVAPVKVLSRSNCAPRFLTYGCAVGLEEMTTALEVHGRRIGLGAHPVGLDMARVQACLDDAAVRNRMEELRAALNGQRLILSVERLDYTKGIFEKLQAYEQLLMVQPELHGKITLVSVCVPAAREMSVYDELQVQIEGIVGRINGRFGRIGWTPVQFFFRYFDFEEIVAYYVMADVMWITPLRDGLNLVAKEYVAAQGLTGGRGVLVLSEFAGAAAELRGALLTNPHDVKNLSQVCYHALNLGRAEARSRLRLMFDIVRHHDLQRWGDDFLRAARGDSQPAESKLLRKRKPAAPSS